jgi:hypothetical protein
MEIGERTFKGCTSLESIMIPKGVTMICGFAFVLENNSIFGLFISAYLTEHITFVPKLFLNKKPILKHTEYCHEDGFSHNTMIIPCNGMD